MRKNQWAAQIVRQIDGSRSRLLLSWNDHTRKHHSKPFPITHAGCHALAEYLTRLINGSNAYQVRILWFDPLRRRWVLLHNLDHFYPQKTCVELWRGVGAELHRRKGHYSHHLRRRKGRR